MHYDNIAVWVKEEEPTLADELLERLQVIRDQGMVLSGQFAGYLSGNCFLYEGNCPSCDCDLENDGHKDFVTSKLMLLNHLGCKGDRIPAMMGIDLGFSDPDHANDVIAELKDWVASNPLQNIVTISWHMDNPWTSELDDPKHTSTVGDIAELIVSSGEVAQRFNEELDETVRFLKKLEGIPILWRPLHEMNGDWFWWSHVTGDSGFVKLWRHMHDHFKGEDLDNLIWVYSVDDNRPYNHDRWYPGSAYVDVIGIDNYGDTDLSKFNTLKSYGKLIGLSEYGAGPACQCADVCFDTPASLRHILDTYPELAFFQAWHYPHSLVEQPISAATLLEESRVVTRPKLPVYCDNLQFVKECPIDLRITAPSGRVVDKFITEIPGATYEEYTIGSEGDSAAAVTIWYPEEGAYNVIPVLCMNAQEADEYTIFVVGGGDTTFLAVEELVADIPPDGYLFSTLDTGSIAGVVASEGVGLLGVPVDLYDDGGIVVASVTTDDRGAYEFAGLDNGDYSATISTPLGYLADEETKNVEVRGLPHEVNFEFTALDITPQQRSRGYWAHQLQKALRNKPKDYSIDEFAGFAGLINVHFNQHAINPVDFYSIPQPASQTDSLNVLKSLLHMRNIGDESEPLLKRLARAQLMALMLNVVSGKVSQTHEISADERTVSQLITYGDMLVSDEIDPPVGEDWPGYGSPWFRYIYASFMLVKANLGLTIPSGMIPEDVMQIAYKTGDTGSLPGGFALHQNYPNPFNPITEIAFSIPDACDVRLDVYNIVGQKVTTLVDGMLQSGDHSVAWDASDVSSGVYFYRLTGGEVTATRKMVLLK